ncbi:PEP-CTERM sorting domain-containing protein [bacterium]|nr:MAG: PEP-CTERM sorting domain-containing protein [bacterium]
MKVSRFLRTTLLAALLCSALAAQAAFYDFESVALGTTTPFSLTDDGITASFSSSPLAGSYEIADASDPGLLLTTLTGHILVEPSITSSLLTISFDQPLGVFSTLFASSSDQPVELNAYSGASLVGTVVVAGVSPGGGSYPEGQIGFAGAVFDRVTLQSQADDEAIGIDNVSVQAVPEPASMIALGAGAVALLRRRRKA